jgi:hypothetical protein
MRFTKRERIIENQAYLELFRTLAPITQGLQTQKRIMQIQDKTTTAIIIATAPATATQ